MKSANDNRKRPNSKRGHCQRKSLGETVRKIRIDHDLTQSDVARALHVTPGFISNVENGRTSMSLKVLVYYAKLTKTSLDSLVGITENDYQVTALDNDIMNILSSLKVEDKEKILETIKVWF